MRKRSVECGPVQNCGAWSPLPGGRPISKLLDGNFAALCLLDQANHLTKELRESSSTGIHSRSRYTEAVRIRLSVCGERER